MLSTSKKMKQKQKSGGENRAVCKSIDDLPPEMLMEILKYIPTSTLISSSCLVNRKWNEISSSLLRHRPDTLLKFFVGSNGSFLLSEIPNKARGELEKMLFGGFAEEEGVESKTLEEFTDCYKSSKNFPFARFSFKKFYSGGEDLKTFLTTIGSKVLSIKINPPENKKEIQLLRNVLITYCPNLQELIFDDFGKYESEIKDSGSLKLFKKGTKINSLPNLKIVHLSRYYKKYLGVVEDILRAASSLKEIEGDWNDRYPTIKKEDIEFLSQHGKLHLIKSATLIGDELAAHWKKFPGQIVKLSKMQIDSKDINMNTFIEYSKDTLKELEILRSDIIPDVTWSLIPNLQKLSLPANQNPTLFPVAEEAILPNLKELEIRCTWGKAKSSSSSRVSFPSVKILKLKTEVYSSQFMGDLCVMFPNVTCLDLSSVENFSEFGQVIWKNMKQLITLCVNIPKNEPDYGKADFDFDVLGLENEYEFSTELDACFTGYFEETCIDLKEEYEDEAEVSEEEVLQYDRENPSIVDLKYLTTLRLKFGIFQCYCKSIQDIKRETTEREQELKENISCVSRLFAFQQMPNLQIMIETEVTEDC